ncbi:unnamed protein product [Closterium sp. NIES-54]
MYITLYFIVTRLPDSLREVTDHFLTLEPTDLTVDLLEKHLLAAQTSVVAVGAARGTPRTPLFEGCPPSLPRLRGMHSRLLRATPHSSTFPLTSAPLETLHMDVKGELPDVLIPWIRAVRFQVRERFREHLPVLRLHFDKGGEFSSDLLWEFCRGENIFQSFMLLASTQQNGIAERRIGLVMEVARTSMIHVVAPHFVWPFAVRYAAHQLNLWPRVSLPETSPTLRWTGKIGEASVFRVRGSRAFVRDTYADKLSSHAIPCVFLGFPPDAHGWQFYHPTSRRVLPSQDVTFDKSDRFYRLFPYRTTPLPPLPLFLAPGPPPVDPLPPQGPTPSGVSKVDPLPLAVPLEGAEPASAEPGDAEPDDAEPGGAKSEGAESRGAEPEGAEPGGTEPDGAEPEGAELEGAESWGAEPRGTASSGGRAGVSPRLSHWEEPLSPQQLHVWFAQRTRVRSGAAGAGGSAAGGTGAGGAGATSLGGAGVPARAGGTGGAGAAGPGGARTSGTGAAGAGGVGGAGAGDPGAGGTGAGDPRARGTGAGGAGAGGTGAGGTGGAGAAGPGGARTRGTGAAGAGGVGGAGAGDPRVGGIGAGGAGAGGAGAVGAGAGDLGVGGSTRAGGSGAGDLGAGGAGAGGAGAVAAGAGGTMHQCPFFVPPPPSSLPPPDSTTAAFALVSELVDFASACRLEYATSLVAEFESDCPPFVGGECALGTDVLEDRQEDFECLAATVPHLVAMLLAPEGDPDAPDIPTPRSYA